MALVLELVRDKLMSVQQRWADVVFLALAVWREARGEHMSGKIGVASCMLNRVARPSWWGTDISSVLFKKWQISSLTDPKDRQLTEWPRTNDPAWIECLEVALQAVDGTLPDIVPGADSYFDESIPNPPWATPERFVAKFGRLLFYNVDQDTETSNKKGEELCLN